jgi:hypothetical protein
MIGERTSQRIRLGAIVAFGLGLALAGEVGCSSGGFNFRRTTSASFLRTIEESRDPNVRYGAYTDLASPRCYDNEQQKAQAAQVLASKLKEGREPTATRAVICRTLGVIARPEAREMILAETNDDDPLVRAEACRALGRVGKSDDATVLARVMTVDVSAECRIAAIESLGDLKSTDKRITQHLVSGMEHDEPAIRVASWHALKSITGKDLGVDSIPWKKYVDSLPDLSVSSSSQPSIPAAAAATLPEIARPNAPEIP